MTNFKMTVRADSAVSTCSPSLCLEKLLPTDGQWGKSAFGQESALPLPHPVAGSEMKQTFLSTTLVAPLLASDRWAAVRNHNLMWQKEWGISPYLFIYKFALFYFLFFIFYLKKFFLIEV